MIIILSGVLFILKKIGVIFGGESVEHDVSILTGVLTCNAVDRELYEVVPIYVDKNGKFYSGDELFNLDEFKNLDEKKLFEVCLLPSDNGLYKIKRSKKTKRKFTRLFSLSAMVNCMHGERGEDGSVSALCSLSHIPLASPDMLASSVCMNKHLSKTMLKGLGIKVVDSIYVKNAKEFLDNKEFAKDFPLIVKPNCLGSSIGIQKTTSLDQTTWAINNALRFGEGVEIEKCLENFIEINCSAYKGSCGTVFVSNCERPMKSDQASILDFDDKYKNGEREFPAKIDQEISEKIRAITKTIYNELQFNGIIRIDFMLVDKEIYVNEINTVPGSLAYYLFCNTIKGFSGILTQLITTAIKRESKRQTEVRSFSSGILGGIKGKGNKGKSS